MEQVYQVLWRQSLLKDIPTVDDLYSYVQNTLDRAYSSEDRNHRELSADPDTGLCPSPFLCSFESISI